MVQIFDFSKFYVVLGGGIYITYGLASFGHYLLAVAGLWMAVSFKDWIKG